VAPGFRRTLTRGRFAGDIVRGRAIVPPVDPTAGPISITRRLITSLVVVLAAGFLGSTLFRKLAAQRKESTRSESHVPPPLVRAVTAHRGAYTETLRGYGRAQPLRRAQVTAEVAGVVLEVSPLLEPGTAITAAPDPTDGAGPRADLLPVLVRIDDRDLVDRLARARDDVAAADAEILRLATVKRSLRERLAVAEEELANAERELDRITPLVPKTLTRSDLDRQSLQVTLRQRAKLELQAQIQENGEAAKVAEARRAALLRTVSLAEREQGRAVVRAPFAGRIEARHVDVGEQVRVGDPLFTLVNLASMQVPIALAAGRYDEVAVGAPARVRLPDQDEAVWEGMVTRIAPQINAAERTFYAYLVVGGSDIQTSVPPGAHVLAEIEGRTHPDVVAVPRRAFLREHVFVASPAPDGAEGVFVISERTPEVSRYLSGVALVTTGIEEGERILVTNLESVAEGSRVRLVIDEAP